MSIVALSADCQTVNPHSSSGLHKGRKVYLKKDISQKELEAHNDVFVDIVNNLVFKGEQILKEEFLRPLPTESLSRKTDGTLRQGNRDVCKQIHGEEATA